jgi:hypothetical protein
MILLNTRRQDGDTMLQSSISGIAAPMFIPVNEGTETLPVGY